MKLAIVGRATEHAVILSGREVHRGHCDRSNARLNNYDYTQHTVTGVTVAGIQAPLTPRFARTTYDGFGRTVKVEAGDNGTGTTLSRVDTQYAPCACSPLGKMSQVSSPYQAGETVVWTKYQYDASGRTISLTAPDGLSVTAYAYQGNQTTVTDAAGKWKQYTTDAMGNLGQVTEPDRRVERTW